MQFSILKIGALISIFILGRLLKKMNAMMNLNTNRGIHMRKGKFLAYSNLDVIKFSVPWKDCLLFWEFYGLKLPHLGKLRSRRGVLRWLLCFNFRVGLRVHWCSTLCSLWPSLGRHPWVGGEAIGPAERNINTTKKITEHVTESYHIETLIKISKRNDALVPCSNYKWNAASPEKCSSFHVYLT